MKKLFVTATITMVCVAAFAQGKIKFINDAAHSVYYGTVYGEGQGLIPGDVAGAAVVSGLTLDFFGGSSAASMVKVGSATLNATGTPGTWLGVSTTIPGVASGAAYLQVFAYSTSAGSYAAAKAGQNLYFGDSGVFTTVVGTSLTYNSIVLATSPALSTWAAGTQDVSGSVAGAKGAIAVVANVPEPTSLALFGLGAASLLIFRRRK